MPKDEPNDRHVDAISTIILFSFVYLYWFALSELSSREAREPARRLERVPFNRRVQIADQRTAAFPVTFALHTMLLLEHNRCCTEVAPELGYSTDEVRWRNVLQDGLIKKCLGGARPPCRLWALTPTRSRVIPPPTI